MIRAVFDTVIFVRSLINPYSKWGEILFSYSSSYQLFVSKPILIEVLEVLKRPELTAKFAALKDLNYSKLLDMIGQAAVVEIPFVKNISRDPKDDIFLATAKACNAHYLVTEDKDLLVLKSYSNVNIITASAFVQILTKRSS